jgi:cobalt-zinc-cadmium efflux system membrane fusion protein
MKPQWTILLLAAALWGWGCRAPNNAVADDPAPKVKGNTVTLPDRSPQIASLTLETAQLRKYAVSHLTGRMVWNENATVRIFSPVAGRVHAVPAKLGQIVAAGEALARILSPELGQAQADVRKANADFLLADRNLQRLHDLFEHGAAARKDVESAESTYAGAQSEKERALVRLQFLGGSNDVIDQMYSLRAPLGGIVVEKNINPGQEVRPDQMLANAPQLFAPLFVISDPSRLWALFDVTELDIAGLKPGQKVEIRTRAFPGHVFAGRVETIGDSLDSATRTMKARAAVVNPDRLLKAEMYVSVDVIGEAQAGVDIPAKAVFLRNGQHFVFVENAPGRYERRAVKKGDENDGIISILDGLQPGQRVVTDGCLLLESLWEAGEIP